MSATRCGERSEPAQADGLYFFYSTEKVDDDAKASAFQPIGVAIGIGAAAAASQILTSVLFGVSRFDPIAFIAAPLCLLAVAAAASLIPARRAMQVDPMSTLRYE